MLLLSTVFTLAWISSVVAAAPYERRWGEEHGRPWWTGSSNSYVGFGKRVAGPNSHAPICDLGAATMPSAPTPLPPPSAGLSLSHVAIGRGTQNYTCDLSNTTAVPVAVGAVATLFNVSCLAADQPDLLAKLTAIALELPPPSTSNGNSPATQDLSGHHYFLDTKTPFFNLDTALHQYGDGAFKKLNSSPAPKSAPVGQYGKGYGAVPWLKLGAKNPGSQVFQEVYRLNTAGGSPSPSCSGLPAAFEVQYSAEYWLYTS